MAHYGTGGTRIPLCDVVTYRGAYIERTVELCSLHDNDRSSPFPLGPVQRGSHKGTCYRCERLDRAGK